MDKTKILKNSPSGKFWIINGLCWSIFSILNFLLQFDRSSGEIKSTLLSIIPMLWGFILTSLLRLYWGKANIFIYKISKLISVLFLHSIILTCLIVMLGIGNILLIREYDGSIFRLLIVNFLSIYFIIVCWIAIYFFLVYYLSYQAKEKDNRVLQNSLNLARLTNLRNQLNPHFLFNSLNNIRSLIREDGEKARDMITSLTDILRYSLNSDKNQLVSLNEEIEFVNEYLKLQHLQMEDRLDYNINAELAVDNYYIPPMIIQLLAENAIKHNLSLLPEGGKLNINILKQDEFLIIEVINSGKLNESTNKSGIGLINIKERLNLLYGKEGEVKVFQENEFVKAVVKIPAGKINENNYS